MKLPNQSTYFFNRELSLLDFNERILDQATKTTYPFLERVKFLSIVSSNLDEFFMVRIARLHQLCLFNEDKKDISGRFPTQQLFECLLKAQMLVDRQYQIYDNLVEDLKSHQIELKKYAQLSISSKKQVDEYYKKQVYPVLTPIVIDRARPFPLLLDQTLNIALILIHKETKERSFATLQVPSVLSRVISTSIQESQHYILLEDLLKVKLHELFNSHEVLYSSCYRIIKNAQVVLDDTEGDDLLESIEASIKERRLGEVIRLEIESQAPLELVEVLKEKLNVQDEFIFYIDGPLDLRFLSIIMGQCPNSLLKFPKINSVLPINLKKESIFSVLKKQDILLHHPFHSFDVIVRMIQIAANDPHVLAIKQTLYRVSVHSPIIEALSKAAENGKQVTVLVELKARFDEENNIHWARQLERAGCHVIYGVLGLKTHCKVLLIVRKETNQLIRYVHFGTGNYNDVTANLYTDMGILTTGEAFGEDATKLFNMLSGYTRADKMEKLIVAPYHLRKKFHQLINREIEHAKQGKKAHIIAKMNGLYDKDLIMKLYSASQAGVKIELIVRGVCCLRPQVVGISENITVRSIVGQFLEHSRIYYFYNDNQEEVFISSADLMRRNLSRRIEVMGAVDDPALKEKIKEILLLYLQDNVNSYELQSDGRYRLVETSSPVINVHQELFYRM